MPRLIVVPHDVVAMMQNEGICLSKLDDPDYMAEHLAISDLADIHFAQAAFPFQFAPELEIQMLPSPLAALATSEKHAEVHYRLNGRIETCSLRNTGVSSEYLLGHSLYPVGENLWVAVQQRLPRESGDPSRLLLKANHALFDGMVAQVLHTFSFEKMCRTNLFTYYLGSL